MRETQMFVGVDVSKARLDVAVRPSGDTVTVPYDEAGIAGLVTRLQAWQPAAVVLEATGDLESAVVSALAAAGLPVHVVNPRQVRAFARATGRLAKTDALDAQLLAQFGEVLRPVPRPLPDEATQALSAVLTRRRQLIEMLTAEKNRLSQARPSLRKRITAHIEWLTSELRRVEADLDTAIRHSPVWREQDDLLQSMPAWAGPQSHDAGRVARTGDLVIQATRGAGRSGAPQSRQWHAARQAHHLAAARWSERPCIWRRSSRPNGTPSSKPSITSSSQEGRPKRWRWWPACTSCSSS